MTKKHEEMDCEKYRNYLRGHTPEEAARLEDSIRQDGCRDPLVVGILGGERFLIDGFHRKGICDRMGIGYEIAERVFACEEDLLSWIENYARARRNQTRTDRNYDIGRQYRREKQEHGGDRKSGRIKGKKVALDRTAELIAAKHKCSHQHVKNCHKFALRLDEVCRGKGGMEWLRDLILSEQVKYSKKLLDELEILGPGGCRHLVEQAVAEHPDKSVTLRMILGEEDKPKEKTPEPETDSEDIEDIVAPFMDRVVDLAEDIPVDKLSGTIALFRSYVSMLESKLQRRAAS